MRVLLDTHVFLWTVTDDRSLKAAARRVIERADEILVSAASIWEIAINSALGKLDADPDALRAVIGPSGFVELPVSALHAARVGTLPPLHRDPFDRLLVAQAITEPLHLLTVDPTLSRYTDLVIAA